MTVGFLNAGVPFGSTMSFLIASPLLNPIIIGMLGAMVGVKAMITYFILAFNSLGIVQVLKLEKAGMQKYVKNVRLKGGNDEPGENKRHAAKTKAEGSVLQCLGKPASYHGILVDWCRPRCRLYGYMPQDFVLKIAGPDNVFAIPVAAVLGIPLYIRAETADRDRRFR